MSSGLSRTATHRENPTQRARLRDAWLHLYHDEVMVKRKSRRGNAIWTRVGLRKKKGTQSFKKFAERYGYIGNRHGVPEIRK